MLGPDSTLIHECDTLQGDSGSPLFIEGRGRALPGDRHRKPYRSPAAGAYDRNVAMYTDSIMAEMRALAAGQTGGQTGASRSSRPSDGPQTP
jgi:protease YdgD